jgi:hypothetical protein
MKPPIFVYDHTDDTVDVYSTKGAAETHFEAQDIPHVLYTAYDSEGYQLEFVPASPIWVEIRPMTPPVNKADELSGLLRDFLKVFEDVSDDWLADASLDELTTKALDYETEVSSWSEFVSKQVNRLKEFLFGSR